MVQRPSPSDPHDGGFALVLVLWLLLLAGAIGSAVVVHARTTREAARTEVNLVSARLLTDGAINRTIAALLNLHDELRFSYNGSSNTLPLLGHAFTVQVEAEAGKVNVNDASETHLRQLLVAVGLAAVDSEALAREIVTWRMPMRADDTSAATYREDGRSYSPRYGPFQSVAELRMVRGMSTALLERLTPLVTVWSHGGTINRSVVGNELLSMLEGSGDLLAATQRAARARGEAASASRLPGIGDVFSIRAHLQKGDLSMSRTAIVQISGDRRQPLAILSWH